MQLKVDGVYIANNGIITRIVKFNESSLNPWFYDRDGCAYRPDGTSYHSTNNNLVAEVSEAMNHQAYDDVLDRQPPSYVNDAYYMSCFRGWRALLPY